METPRRRIPVASAAMRWYTRTGIDQTRSTSIGSRTKVRMLSCRVQNSKSFVFNRLDVFKQQRAGLLDQTRACRPTTAGVNYANRADEPMDHHRTTTHDGHLEAQRLAAAIEAVTTRYNPDQVILFGSAVRGTMTEDSDIDLLLIKTDDHQRSGIDRDSLELNGDELDVVTMSPEEAERHRRTGATVHQEALAQGRTVYCRNGSKPLVPAGPSWMTSENGMVKNTRLKPDESSWLLGQAQRHWGDRLALNISKESRCYHLHQAIEQCLKGIITAQGREFQHIHKLEKLWKSAEAEGEKIPSPRDDKLLERLTKYAEGGRYEKPDEAKAQRMLEDGNKLGETIMQYARDAIPRLSRETMTTLAATPKLIKPSDRFIQGKQIDHASDETRSSTLKPKKTADQKRGRQQNIPKR